MCKSKPTSVSIAAYRLARMYQDNIPLLVRAVEYRFGVSLQSYVISASEAECPSIVNGIAGFTAEVLSKGVLVVSNENCDNTVYPSPVDNQVFRMFHDLGHILYQCEFNTEGENTLHGLMWTWWLEKSPDYLELSVDDKQLVRLVYEADTYGQTQSFEDTGEFPINQWEFVCAYVERVIQ